MTIKLYIRLNLTILVKELEVHVLLYLLKTSSAYVRSEKKY